MRESLLVQHPARSPIHKTLRFFVELLGPLSIRSSVPIERKRVGHIIDIIDESVLPQISHYRNNHDKS